MLVMGWGDPPKPDPKLVAAQQSEAERAKQDRILLLQEQLGGADQLRSQIYGRRTGSDQGSGGGGGNGGGRGGGGGGGLGGQSPGGGGGGGRMFGGFGWAQQ